MAMRTNAKSVSATNIGDNSMRSNLRITENAEADYIAWSVARRIASVCVVRLGRVQQTRVGLLSRKNTAGEQRIRRRWCVGLARPTDIRLGIYSLILAGDAASSGDEHTTTAET